MSNKRKRSIFLDQDERLEIINWLNASMSVAAVAREFGISEDAVRRINRQDRKLLKSDKEGNSTLKRSTEKKKRVLLDECLVLWYKQRRALSESVASPIIKEAAQNMSETWPELEEFNSSNKWLVRFRNRHDIQLKWAVRHVKSVWNPADHKEFQMKLSEMKKEHGVEDHQLYDADEMEIYWRLLPNKLGNKVYEEKVTVMVCSNASGTHKVPLFVIGKEKNPKCFEGVEKIPVHYTGQEDALMDKELLLYWYENVFFPSVREYQRKTQKTEKVLLIMDTAPFRPSKTEFNSIDPLSQVEYFPKNIPSIIHPMSCGITNKLRMNYKEQFINSLSQAKTELMVEAMVENYSLVDFCFSIASAWEAVSQENITRAWSNNLSEFDFSQDKLRHEREQLMRVLQQVPGYQRTFLEGVISWIHKEAIRPGWKVMTNDELVKIVTG